MNFLIQPKDEKPFLTNWFEFENHYSKGMVIYNLISNMFSSDGDTLSELLDNQLAERNFEAVKEIQDELDRRQNDA